MADRTSASPSDPPPAPAPSSAPGLDVREVAFRALALVGLAVSAILLVDYTRPVPVFCSAASSGCTAVRNSVFGHVGPLPVPVLGVAFFSLLLALAGFEGAPRARRLLGMFSGVGAVAGAGLLLVQALVVHHWCKFCVVVDVSSVALGALGLALQDTRGAARRMTAQWNIGTAVAALLAVLVPVGYGLAQPVPRLAPPPRVEAQLPEAVAREQRPGVATIVEFVDFECPYCRREQEALSPVLASYGGRVRLVRKNVPLSFHEHARDAARAACCADEQSRGDRMAEALFRSNDLTPAGCERIAREIGLDMDGYRACLASTRPDVAIERDHDLARSIGISGLPTFYVGRERFEGLQSAEAVRTSIEHALHDPGARPGADPGARPGADPGARSGT